VLLIHTDSTGEIRKAELPVVRKAAKFIVKGIILIL